jgi:hypothetical protein
MGLILEIFLDRDWLFMPNCIPNKLDSKIGVLNQWIDGWGRFKSLKIFSLLNFLDEQCPLHDQIL